MEDPENLDEIIAILPTLKSMGEIFALIEKVYPKWVLKIADQFSKDYPLFEKNWDTICTENKVSKAKILLVSRINFNDEEDKDDNFKLIRIFSELLTRAGFVVRDYRDIILCSVCKSVLPTEGMYKTLIQMKVKEIPDKYITICRGC